MYYANQYQPYGAQSSVNTYQPPVHGVVTVNGRAGCDAFYLPPNSDGIFVDENSDTIFFKYTDGAGYPTTIECDYTIKQQPTENKSDYATKEDITRLEEQLNQCISKFNEVEGLLNA